LPVASDNVIARNEPEGEARLKVPPVQSLFFQSSIPSIDGSPCRRHSDINHQSSIINLFRLCLRKIFRCLQALFAGNDFHRRSIFRREQEQAVPASLRGTKSANWRKAISTSAAREPRNDSKNRKSEALQKNRVLNRGLDFRYLKRY